MDTMNFSAVWTVKKEFEKEDFLRALIIKLGTQIDTPIDVVDAEFGEVEESVREVIMCSAKVEGDCSASIGYDRQEPYIAYENYQEKVGDRYVTRQRQVTKYKTITDWQLFQTKYAGKATCAVYNSDGYYGYDSRRIAVALTSAKRDNLKLGGEASLDPAGLSNAIIACQHEVEHTEVKFPGDRQKDVKYNSKSEIDHLTCHKLPYYEVEYTYKGKSYTASCFACGEMNIQAETPPNDIDITTVVKEQTAKLEKKRKNSWILFVGSLVLAAFLCFVLKFAWLFPLPIALLIKAKKDSDKYSDAYQKCSDNLTQNVAQSKLTALKFALEARGFETVSQDTCESLENCSIPGAAELKPVKKRIKISWVLTIILTLVSIITINSVRHERLHSPRQLEINVIGKEEEYKSNASYYSNGCYYIHFDYEIEAKKTGIEYVELKVYVSDKQGNELGFIRSSLSDINADAGDTKIITLTLSESRPEENAFFTQLYNADFSDLVFKYEIGSIQFSDGEYYHNREYNQFK